jgi:serine/threonine protein kinase
MKLGDIKPGNLVLGRDGLVKITGLGLGHVLVAEVR